MKLNPHFSFLFLLFVGLSNAQNDKAAFEHFKDSLNQNFHGVQLSPLSPAQKTIFNQLNFYEFNPDFVVEARFERNLKDDTVALKTTTARIPVYEVYGYLHFELNGKKQKLAVLKSSNTAPDDEYADYLSVMFTDETSGKGSYSVGRYMGLHAPLPEKLVLNFNHTYNPYCAYSNRYSCPIPPAENHINVAVEAGVKPGFE
ncbi:hypothetical protein BST97_00555 [Nonlabens spongiae]|uniref:DUF1684 domain-containing protein n=1 Tax=Nonlabens spongiae TaxID=331648 RepID=A0A1W6MG85_9FLAO|nr:DUF1684 domain-containing protein [Nonlabens spongiae]ARN76614.1 hypothetical protein BST97_00555 [Nonlabens spongiae]